MICFILKLLHLPKNESATGKKTKTLTVAIWNKTDRKPGLEEKLWMSLPRLKGTGNWTGVVRWSLLDTSQAGVRQAEPWDLYSGWEAQVGFKIYITNDICQSQWTRLQTASNWNGQNSRDQKCLFPQWDGKTREYRKDNNTIAMWVQLSEYVWWSKESFSGRKWTWDKFLMPCRKESTQKTEEIVRFAATTNLLLDMVNIVYSMGGRYDSVS